MRLISRFVLVLFLGINLYGSDEKISINFKDLKIMDLIKITSKIIDKNILITEDIKGNVDFVSNKPVNKEELIKILGFVLEDKGFTIINNNEILRIVKLNDSASSNVPIITHKNQESLSVATEIFTVYNADVDYIASKIRHLVSKNGKLVTNKESNTLVITDFVDNINTVKEVVDIMTTLDNKDSLVVELKNIKASDAKKNLDLIAKSKFNDKIETEKISIIDNKENNSILLIGKGENIKYLEKYISEVDNNGSLIKREVEVIPLKNVEATNVIKIVDSIVGKKIYIDPNDKPLASIDEESNSLVIMGPSDELDYIKSLIEELDKDKPQVYVQARIIEVSENKTKNVGLKYGITAFDKDLGVLSADLGGTLITSNFLESLGISYSGVSSALGLSASLNLLKQNQALDIVSEPSILCINNKESSIYVGETRSFQTGTTTGTTTTTNFKREDIGLTLKVKPRISNENKVTLEINTVLEDAKEILNENQGNPDTTKKEVKTSAIVSSGESVIIGGLIKNKSDITNNDVPFFSDIPVLGNLFKNKKRVDDKINLVVIVTPYVIPKSKDLNFIRTQLAKLKSLEDRYTEELKIRLQERKIELQKEEIERIKKDKELKEELEELNQEKNKLLNASQNSSDDNRSLHEKRVAEILGY